MPTAAELVIRVRTDGAGKAKVEIEQLGQQVEQTSQRASQGGKRFKALRDGISQLSPVALGATGAVVGVGLALKSTIDASISWESALAGVAKTVDGTDAEIQALGDALRAMALEIPIAATELAAIAEQAGALGIAKEDILEFTEVAALIGVTTDVSSEQAATALGQLSNVLGLTADEYERFASTLVDLGNKGASTESQILSIASRAGAAGELIGLATDETLAWSAAVANLGIEVEAGGSSIQRFFLGMLEHVSAAGEELAIIAETAGTTAGAFQQAFAEDANAALVTFIEGLGRLAEAERLAVLEALGFNDVRITRALLGLAGNTDNLTDSLKNGEKAWRDNSAMAEEAGKRFETSASQIQLAKNEMIESAIVLGDELAPAFVAIIQGAAEATDILTKLAVMLKETGAAAIEVSGGGPSGGAGLSDYLSGLESAFRLASGGSQDLEHDFKNLANTLLLGRPAIQGTTDDAEEMGSVFLRVADGIREMWPEVIAELEEQQLFEELAAGVPAFTTQLDALRDAGIHAAQQMRADWEAQFAAMGEAVAMVPEAAGEFIDELVVAFRAGQADIGDVWSIIGQMPQEELIPALHEVRAEWLTTVAEMGDAEEVREATRNLEALDAILGELGISLVEQREIISGFAADQSALAGAYQLAGSNAAIFNQQAGEFGAIAGDLEDAYDTLNKRKEEGVQLSDEELRFLERYPETYGRVEGAVEDATIQAGLYRQAQVDLMIAQDELNDAINRGEQDLGPYKDAVADAERSLGDAATAAGGMRDANSLLVDLILMDLTPALRDIKDLLAELGGIEAKPKITMEELVSAGPGGMGFTAEDGGTAYTGLSGRIGRIGSDLDNLDGQSAMVTANITDNAIEPLSRIEEKILGLDGDSFTVTAYVDIGPALQSIATLDAHLPHSPAEEGPLSVEPNWDWLFEGLEASAEKYTAETLEHITNYVRAAQAAFGVLGTELEFLSDAAAFEATGGTMPSEGLVAQLKFFAEHVTQSIGDSAALFETEFLEHAETFASAAEAGLRVIADALSLFEDLQDFEGDLDAAKEAASTLKFLIEHITLSIGDSAVYVASERPDGFTGAAQMFAEHALPAVELIAAGVEAITAIAEFEGEFSLDDAREFASQLKFLVEHITLSIGDSAALLAAERPGAFYEGIEGYATAVEQSVGLIDDVVDSLEFLMAFDPEGLTVEQVHRAAEGIAGISRIVAEAFRLAAAGWEEDATPEIEAFTTAAGDSLGLVTDAVDAIMALTDPEQAEGEGRLDLVTAAEKLAGDIGVVIGIVQDLAAEYGTEGVEGWSDFADAAAKSVRLVSEAADSFNAIADMSEVTEKHTDRFRDNFQAVLELVGSLDDMAQAYVDDAITFNELMIEIAEAMENAAAVIDVAAGTVGDSARGASGGSGGGGGSPGGGGGSPAPVGGGGSPTLADFGISLMDGEVLTFEGFGPRGPGGQSLWAAIRGQAIALVDADGLNMPERGFDLWQWDGQLHVNAFDRGGFTLGEGLAYLHPHEAVLNPSSQMLQPLAEAIVAELRRASGGAGGAMDGDLVVNISTGDSPLGMSTYRQPLSYVRHTNVAARR